MSHKCPGMNHGNWLPKDIKEVSCDSCGYVMEFWKDDVRRVCPGCQKKMFNPNLANVCLSWCDKAEECLGSMNIKEWKKTQKNKDTNSKVTCSSISEAIKKKKTDTFCRSVLSNTKN